MVVIHWWATFRSVGLRRVVMATSHGITHVFVYRKSCTLMSNHCPQGSLNIMEWYKALTECLIRSHTTNSPQNHRVPNSHCCVHTNKHFHQSEMLVEKQLPLPRWFLVATKSISPTIENNCTKGTAGNYSTIGKSPHNVQFHWDLHTQKTATP